MVLRETEQIGCIYIWREREIYCMELAHLLMKAEESQSEA